MGDRTATVVLVADDGSERVVGSVDARRPDLVLVDALARLQLTARRRGRRLALRDVPDDLRGLLELVGLDRALALEPRRQPERGEELGIQEVVQSGDPPV